MKRPGRAIACNNSSTSSERRLQRVRNKRDTFRMEKFYPTLSQDFARLLAALAGRKVAVVGHARPDGDCIGAQVALARVLASAGHDVVCVNADPVPRRL